jgi:hypothetical protein
MRCSVSVMHDAPRCTHKTAHPSLSIIRPTIISHSPRTHLRRDLRASRRLLDSTQYPAPSLAASSPVALAIVQHPTRNHLRSAVTNTQRRACLEGEAHTQRLIPSQPLQLIPTFCGIGESSPACSHVNLGFAARHLCQFFSDHLQPLHHQPSPTMALPEPIIPAAPTPLPVPLPPPAPGPIREPTEISYTAYSPSPSSLALHEDRMKRIKEWTAEVPVKHHRPRLEDLGAGGTGSGSTVTFGQAVGVGSADWSDASGSETGTVPTTVRQERKERIELVRAHQSVSVKRPAPPEASSIILAVAAPAPPTEAKSTASKHAGHSALAPASSSPQVVPKAPTKPPSAASRVRSPPVPLLALPPSASAPKIPPTPSPRLAAGSGDLLYSLPPVGATHSQREAYIASALDLPLDLLAQRDNALAPPARLTPPSSASSQITTSRLGSLLGRTKGDGRRVASEGTGAGSATGSLRRTANAGDAWRSRQDQGRQASAGRGTAVMGALLARSKTAGAALEGTRAAAIASHTTSHPPPVSSARTLAANNAVPASIPAQGVRSNATAIMAAAQPLPQSSGRTISHPDHRPDATLTQTTPRPPLAGPSANSHTNSRPTRPGVPAPASARPPPPPAVMTAPNQSVRTERTAVQAAHIPLPVSATRTAPSSQATVKPVKMSIDPDPFAAPPPSRLTPSAATYIQAAQIPMPVSALPHSVHGSQNESVKITSHHQYALADSGAEPMPLQYTQTWPRSAVDRLAPPLPPAPPQPLHVPLAPPASGSPVAPPISATHRQQLALPRPALSRSAGSFDGLARTLGRKQRDPSLTNLHTRFEPALYPLPPSATASTPVTLPLPPVPVSVSARAQHEGPLTGQTPADMLLELPQAPLTRTPEVVPQPAVAQWQGPVLPVPARPQFPVNYFDPMPVPPVPAAMPLLTEPAFLPAHLTGIVNPQLPVVFPPIPLVGNPLPEIPLSPARLQASNDASPRNIQVTPSSGEVERVREEEDHVSFEVPSGSRGRLRVSLAWLRDGTRSPRWRRAQTVRSEVSASSPPPPVPPKPPSAAASQRQTAKPTNPPRVSDNGELPPAPRPVIRDPPKREDAKSPVDPGESAQSPKPTPPQAPGWFDPYYSGATLPPYGPHAQITQVYQMQLGQPNPWGFSQPGPMPVTPTYNPWTGMAQARLPGAGSHGPPTIPPPSPRPDSVEPPSDNGTPPSPPMGPYPLPGGGYPSAMLGMQAPVTNAYGDLTRRYLAPPKQSFWSKLRGERGGRDERDGLRQQDKDDNATTRAWRRNINRDGEAIGAQQMGRDRNYPVSTMGRGIGLERVDLLDAPPLRRRGSSAWDRLMWRRRTEEGYYSRPRRSRQNDGATGRAPTFPSAFGLPFGRNNTARRERKGAANGTYQSVGQDRQLARRDREREKEERRRARRERRDGRQARAKASTSGMGSQRPYNALGLQSRPSAMGSQNRPNALESQASAARARSPAPRVEETRRRDRGYEDNARSTRARGQATVSRWFSNVVKSAQPVSSLWTVPDIELPELTSTQTGATRRPAAAEARNDGPPRREASTRRKEINWKDRLASRSRGDTKLRRGPTEHSSRPAHEEGTGERRKDRDTTSQWDRVRRLVGTRG